MNITLILMALRTLSTLAPTLIGQGLGTKISKILDTVATLGERGEAAKADLEALVAKLQAMDGVSDEARLQLMSEIESQHEAILAAARDIPPA